MEEIEDCSHKCQTRQNHYIHEVNGISLTIYNLTHYHQVLDFYNRKNTIITCAYVYLNDHMLFSIPKHWRPGEHLQEFNDITSLQTIDGYSECLRMLNLYCRDVPSLLNDEGYICIHLMDHPWSHNSFNDFIIDFICAFNMFHQTRISKYDYASELDQLEALWKINHFSESGLDSWLSESSSLPNILLQPSA
jgi:hypothetical protein